MACCTVYFTLHHNVIKTMSYQPFPFTPYFL